MTNSLEEKIVSNLLYNSEFAAKVIPYTKEEYFEDYPTIVDEIVKFFVKYGCAPTKDELKIEIQSRKGLTDKEVKNSCEKVSEIPVNDKSDFNWLIEKTEKFYKGHGFCPPCSFPLREINFVLSLFSNRKNIRKILLN